MGEFRMPTLGADMEAGTLVQWLKHPGDQVRRGDIIAVVDTQKGAIEIEVFEDGVLQQALVEPGTKVPVGTVLAMIGASAAGDHGPGPQPPEPAHPDVRRHRARVSPLAKTRAADLHVDLQQVHGTGPDGAITREDVERAANSTTRAPGPNEPGLQAKEPRGDMRVAIAAAMARSKREIPHYYLSTAIDMSAAMTWLREQNEGRPVTERLLAIALLIKAVALALHDVPDLNGHWVDGGFRPGAGIHIGCAVALRGGGLIAPALHDVDRTDVTTLMRQMTDLVARARAGSLRSSELTDSTITVTSLGEHGVDAVFGIIYPPQVALVGFGRIADRPWASAGAVEIRPVVTATLAADHRASDGHRGGLLLAAIDRRLQKPEQL